MTGTAAFLLGGPTSAAADGSTAEWLAFQKFGEALYGLVTSPMKVAELIDQQRFFMFVAKCQVLISEVEAAKRDVRDGLRAATCQGEDPYMRQAAAAAHLIREKVPELGVAAVKLSSAIKPPGLRKAADEAAEGLSELKSRKMWVDRVGSFCGPPSARQAFLDDVDASLAIVRECRERLGQMVDKLQTA